MTSYLLISSVASFSGGGECLWRALVTFSTVVVPRITGEGPFHIGSRFGVRIFFASLKSPD